MRSDQLLWLTKQHPKMIGFLSNKSPPSIGRSHWACISSRITTGIHVVKYHQINYNWYNELSAVSQYKCLYLDLHGLIFETSICYWQDQPGNHSFTHASSQQRFAQTSHQVSPCTKGIVMTHFHTWRHLIWMYTNRFEMVNNACWMYKESPHLYIHVMAQLGLDEHNLSSRSQTCQNVAITSHTLQILTRLSNHCLRHICWIPDGAESFFYNPASHICHSP
jgi:hypothetical protein